MPHRDLLLPSRHANHRRRRRPPARVADRGRNALSVDGRTVRRVAITLVPLVALALVVDVVGARDSVGSYERLLPSVSTAADDPSFGPLVAPDAATQGLLLSAAVAADDDATRRPARAWLDAHRSPGGWGMPSTWDPFSDGSPTTAGTPFASTTAFAIDGLLDDGMDPETAREIGAILVLWAREAWSDGFFWYSVLPQDAVDVPSVSAMLGGVTARFLQQHGDEALSQEDATFLRERVGATFRHLADTQLPGLRWSYSARDPIVNHTQLHVSILWGGELARDAGIDPGWSRSDAITSLKAYGPVYPPEIVDKAARRRRDNSPWATAGTGFATAWTTRWGSDLRTWSSAMCRSLTVAPRVARYDVHALLGLALLGWCDCPDRPRVLPRLATAC